MDKYTIISDNGCGLFSKRLTELYDRVAGYLKTERQEGRALHYTKVFLSDIANQYDELCHSPLMTDIVGNTAHTIIQQSPVGGSKIAVLLKTSDEADAFTLQSLRLTDDEIANFGSYVQTIMLFDKYIALLKQQGLNLKDHCVRTWIYVRDIDTNYDGVVKARNDVFRQHGLTADLDIRAQPYHGARGRCHDHRPA